MPDVSPKFIGPGNSVNKLQEFKTGISQGYLILSY